MASTRNGPIPDSPVAPPTATLKPEPVRTFLFTDVEGSTRLWEQYPETMRLALARHDAILRSAIVATDGDIVKSTGDGLMAVFAAPRAAVNAGIAAQRALLAEPWPQMCSIRVRVGIHSGEADARGGDYFGPAVNRTARIMAAGHGGQILLSRATAELVGSALPAGVGLRDLGEHRLKDLGHPERLFQLTHPDLPAEFAQLATLDVRPNNLPTETSAFVGRDAELRTIRTRLDDPSVRLVTLTGPGGTGKTRLALRAAADQIDRFSDGVYLVDVLSATDGDAVFALMATAIGLADTTERSPLDELSRRLRTQRVLLVLDNFEQVTVAGPMLVDLLGDCPDLKLLVTSREALRVRGENVVSVPPLSLPAEADRATSATELSQFEAIQLFVERARAVRSDFRLTDDNAAAVAEICRRLDGLPLAIELATARMNLFSPEALRDRLGSRLKLLGGGARDLPARQQTLRATIEWSYQLLDPAEQRLFEMLSVFAGASVEAIEAVADGLDVVAGVALDAIDGLGSLLDKSLVRQTDPSGADPARILLLETIKEYATERLAAQSDFATAARDHHARFFAELAAAASSSGSDADRDGDAPADTIALEADNLLIAWHHAVGRVDVDRLAQLRDPLWHLHESRGWYHRTVEMLQDQLAVLAADPARAERWQEELTIRTTLARTLTLLRGYTGEVEDAYAEALALVEGQREVPQLFPILRSLASFHGFRGEFDKGVMYAHQILRLAEAQNDESMRVDAYTLLGSYTGFMGQLDEGLVGLDKAIRAFESRGYRARRLRLGIDARVSSLTTSGFFLWLRGYPDQAAERAERAITVASELEHPYSHAYALYHSGFLRLWRREFDAVEDRAIRAVRVAETRGLPVWKALGTCLLGAATAALDRPDEGLRLLDDGLDQYHGLRTPPVFWPMIRYMQAAAHVDAGLADPGMAYIDEALAIGGPDEVIAPLFHVTRGDLLLLGPGRDVAAATRTYEEAFAVAQRFDSPMPQLRAAVRLVRVATDAERPARVAAVREVHARITEGFDTLDLREAAELLG